MDFLAGVYQSPMVGRHEMINLKLKTVYDYQLGGQINK